MSEEQTTEQPVEQTTEQPVVEAVVEETKGWVNDDGTFNRDSFGELGKHTVFDKLKSVEDMAKAYVNLEQLKGKKIEDIVNSEDPEIQSKLREMKGVPEDASGYDFAFDIPEELGVSEERMSGVKDLFKELGVPKEVGEKLVEWDINNAKEAREQMVAAETEALETAQKQLTSKWKNETSNNLTKVANALDYLELGDLAEDVRNPTSARAITFAEKIYEKIVPLIQNDEIIQARQSQTIATTKDRMDDLRTDMLRLQNDGKGKTPEYQKLVREMGELISKVP